MIYLFAMLGLVLFAYILLMFLVMKRMIPWRYKAFIYGALTFSMLIGVFWTFAYYEKNWNLADFTAKDAAGNGRTE